MLQVISYYSRRGGLGGVSVVTEKSDFSLTSFLLIRDANADDQVYVVYGLTMPARSLLVLEGERTPPLKHPFN